MHASKRRSCLSRRGGVQTALAEHYQALLHTNDFYQYLTLFKELGQKQTQQQSRGRKINAMDTYFYQMVERVLREELAVAFGGIAAGSRQASAGGFALKTHGDFYQQMQRLFLFGATL